MKRRELLRNLAVAGTVIAPPGAFAGASRSDRLGAILPRRVLGKTGEQVTCLGLGGFHVGWPEDEAVVQAVIETALEEGIRFFDTAESYGKGLSEERYGRYLVPNFRDDIFLMTKTQAHDAATAQQHLEGSLSRLKTDMIDLWQIHSLKDPADADDRLAKGILDVALKAQADGKVRHIGFTGHASPYAHVRMTEHQAVLDACSTCQFPINPVDAAAKHSFVETTIPKMLENNIGILAMKTLADGRFFAQKAMNGKVRWTSENPVVPNALSITDCINFALSLPISVLITGAENPELVREKASMVRNFARLSEKQRLALADKVSTFAEQGEVEYYKNKDLRLPKKPS
ncbi:aldo/keto reductase [Pontiellaceae bacterium B12227]|nr:aldo/keto reductase [Pontiellaceae bacterium B12227]